MVIGVLERSEPTTATESLLFDKLQTFKMQTTGVC